jgi:hypothetical protein
MYDELEGSSFDIIKVLSQHLPLRTEENHENPARIAGILADYILNTNLSHNCYMSPI